MKMNDRKIEILQYLQSRMKEYFYNSCQLLQLDIEAHGNEIWSNLKYVIDEILKGAQKEQWREQKGDIQYLVVSFLRISLHQDNIKFRIEVFDDGFYMDRKEISRNYFPSFLQKKYSEDLSRLYKDAGSKFVRLQGYELLWIKEQYTHYYEAIVYRMIENLSRLIMRKVEESSISVTDDFKIIYGEFMDKAVILYTKEKDKDGVFSD